MISVTDRLDEALHEKYVEYDDAKGEKTAWSVQTQDDAAWASRKLAKANAQVQAVSEWEAREIERIKAVAESERKRYSGEIEFFEGHLGEYLIRLRREGRKTKSLPLPGGTIKLTGRQPKFEITDEEKALAWLKQNEYAQYVKVEETLKKGELKKAVAKSDDGKLYLAETGESIDWATLEEQADSISFTPAEMDEEPS